MKKIVLGLHFLALTALFIFQTSNNYFTNEQAIMIMITLLFSMYFNNEFYKEE